MPRDTAGDNATVGRTNWLAVVLRWVAESLRGAGMLALLVLVWDAWQPAAAVFPDPERRLFWVIVVGALFATGSVFDQLRQRRAV